MDPFAFLIKLQELGVAFSISVPVPGGWNTFGVGPDTVIGFSEDPMAFYAQYYGVSKAAFTQCIDALSAFIAPPLRRKGIDAGTPSLGV